MSLISQICDWIVLIAAVLAAVGTIANMAGKPFKFLRKRRQKEINDACQHSIEVVLPKLIEEHDAQLGEKITQQIEDTITAQLEPIKEELVVLSESSKDQLREKIMEIYYKNCKDRTLTIYEKGALKLCYKNYEKEGGNSYIPRFIEEMDTWTVLNGIDDD